MSPRPWMDELAVEATLRRDLDEALEALRDIVEALRIHAPGTPLNNHNFDALGAKANAVLSKHEARR